MKGKNRSNLKECTYYVEGMHCASCEVLIEKKLLKQNGVESVEASLHDGKVEMLVEYGSGVNLDQINKEFRTLGYTFSNKVIKKSTKPLFALDKGRLTVNVERAKYYSKLLLVVLLLFTAFFAFDRLQLGQYINVDATSSLPAFFVLGLVAGISSCAALIGGLLLSMIKQWNEVYIDATDQQKAVPHILFHTGRVLAFVLLGGVLGLIGEKITLTDSLTFSYLTIGVSLGMVLLALQMLDVAWSRKIRLATPKFVSRFIADEENFKGRYMPFLIGTLTFFLPCGFTLIAQTVALTSGSFITGSMIMLFFALGTLPVLLGISFTGIKFNAKPHLTAKFNIIAGLVVLFFAIYNVNGQLNVLGYPSLNDIFGQGVTEGKALYDGDTQIIKIVAKGFEYIPTSSLTIEAGKKAKMLVDNQGISGCGAFIAARDLIDGFVTLEPGENVIDLGTPAKGEYKLTCSMGMVEPLTIKVV